MRLQNEQKYISAHQWQMEKEIVVNFLPFKINKQLHEINANDVRNASCVSYKYEKSRK